MLTMWGLEFSALLSGEVVVLLELEALWCVVGVRGAVPAPPPVLEGLELEGFDGVLGGASTGDAAVGL